MPPVLNRRRRERRVLPVPHYLDRGGEGGGGGGGRGEGLPLPALPFMFTSVQVRK